MKSAEKKLLEGTICKSIVLNAQTSLIEKRLEREGVAESIDTNLLSNFISLYLQMKLPKPNKIKLTKIIICIIIALFIAILSSLNTAANMPAKVKIEKYQLTQHNIQLRNAWYP